MLIGNFIKDQFLTTSNWPLGSAASVILTLLMFLLLVWYFVSSRAGPTRAHGGGEMKQLSRSYTWPFIYLFLYIPILVLVIYSFNNTRFSTNWQGFTLTWYGKLFTDGPLMEAFANSLIIAFSSSTIATILGTLRGLCLLPLPVHRPEGHVLLYLRGHDEPGYRHGHLAPHVFHHLGFKYRGDDAASGPHHLLPAVRGGDGLCPHQRLRQEHHRRCQGPGCERAQHVPARRDAHAHACHHCRMASQLHAFHG